MNMYKKKMKIKDISEIVNLTQEEVEKIIADSKAEN